MPLQADIKEAMDGGRDDLIRVLASHRVVPSVVEGSGGSGLLDRASPTFKLDPQGEDGGTIDRQTTALVVDELGLDSEDDCEAVREEIESHDAWGG